MFTEATTAISAPSTRVRSLGLGLIVAAIALLSLFGRTGDAKAGFAWCADDPIISVNGQNIQIWVNVPFEDRDQVKVAHIEFHVPSNADARIVLVDQTFVPEKAVIKKDLPAWNGKGDLLVKVKIHIDTRGDHGPDFPIRAEVIDAVGTTWYDGSSDQDLAFTAVAISRDGRHGHDNSSNANASR
jgi:hypothetical protein